MFVIPCKYQFTSNIIELVVNINKFHPDEKIMIADSNSKDHSYFLKINQKVKGNNLYLCHGNNHYCDSAIWEAYFRFKDEQFFFLLHDSMMVYKNMDVFKNYEFTSSNWLEIKKDMPINTRLYYSGFSTEKTMIDAKNKLETHTKFKFLYEYIGLFGTMFICHRNILDKLYEGGLGNILPTNKETACTSERIWGMCLQQIGVDIRKNTIFQGNMKNFSSEYCIKNFLRRS